MLIRPRAAISEDIIAATVPTRTPGTIPITVTTTQTTVVEITIAVIPLITPYSVVTIAIQHLQEVLRHRLGRILLPARGLHQVAVLVVADPQGLAGANHNPK